MATLSPLALLLFLLVSVVLPLVSSLLTTTKMPDEVRGILTLVLAGVTGTVTEWAKSGDGFDWRTAVKTALVAFVIAVAGRVALWRGTKTDGKLLAVGSKQPQHAAEHAS
jgi:hypothetical protein